MTARIKVIALAIATALLLLGGCLTQFTAKECLSADCIQKALKNKCESVKYQAELADVKIFSMMYLDNDKCIFVREINGNLNFKPVINTHGIEYEFISEKRSEVKFVFPLRECADIVDKITINEFSTSAKAYVDVRDRCIYVSPFGIYELREKKPTFAT